MNVPLGCPEPQAWLDHAAGRLDAPARERLAAHLDECDECLAIAGEALADHRQAPTRDGSPQAPARREAQQELTQLPQRIGRYLVLELLGAGGMGEVLLAYDPSLDRRVAIKLAQRRAGDDTRGLEARLEREAQLLARATDRHVVAVYDTGKVDGRPYVAMEYVPGTTLKTWLAKPRTRAGVLRVFTQAARGLAAAHRVGVVHRDFKPDNVLLDQQGRARVTDFGLASLREAPPAVRERPDDETQPLVGGGTQSGVVMGTPGYMSPEQWDARPTDARSDQFSFCVALHEALLGERPFLKPSIRGTKPTFERTQTSLKRLKEQPRALRALLTRGLSLDPAARFESMDTLIAGLERAQRPYRLPWIVAATACAAIGLGGAAWASRSPCHGALARIQAPRLALGTLPPRVAVLGEALETSWASAWDTACAQTHERREQPPEVLALRNDCLGRQASRYQQVLQQVARPDPAASAAAMEALELSPRAEDCLAVEPLLSVEPPLPSAKVEAAALREQVWTARVSVDLGQYAQARELLTKLEAPVRAVDYRRLSAEYEYGWALLSFRERDYRAARTRYHAALGKAVAARDFELAAWAGAELLFVSGAQLGLVEEGQLIDGLTGALVAKLGSASLAGKLENTRGAVAMERGRFDDAQAHLLEARRLREAVYGARHLETANVIGNLGTLATRRDRLAEAEPLLREELAIREALLGPKHPQLALTLVSLASCLLEQGNNGPAVELAERAYAVRKEVLGPGHRLTHVSRSMLAEYLLATERFDEARALQLETLAAYEEGSLDAANVASALAALEQRAGRLDEALKWCRAAQAVFDVRVPKEEVALWEKEREAEVLLAKGDGRGAERLLAGLEREWRSRPDAATRLADVLLLRARALVVLGRADAALPLATEGRAIYLPLDFWVGRRAEVDLVMGQVWFAVGRREEALALVKKARGLLISAASRREAQLLDAWLAAPK